MIVDFIGMPLNLGARKRGVEKGTEMLRELCLNTLYLKNDWRDIGDIECENISPATDNTYSLLPNITSIISANIRLRNTIIDSLKRGHFPFIAGGDHSLAWGSLSAVMNVFDNPICYYIDAHGDFNTKDTSDSHNVHGMHMSYIMGFDTSNLSGSLQNNRTMSPQNIKFIGQRSLDKGELRFIEKYSIPIYQDSKEIPSSKNPSHISFDIDVLDPLIAPGTGVPEVNGWNVDKVKECLTDIFRKSCVRSFDFVEINPLLDIDHKTRDLASSLIKVIDNLIFNYNV